jgi:hypothetical protein
MGSNPIPPTGLRGGIPSIFSCYHKEEKMNTIRTSRVEITDEQGNVRAILGMTAHGGVALTMYNQRGELVLGCGITPMGMPGMQYYSHGEAKLSMGVGSQDNPWIEMSGENGTTIISDNGITRI